MRNGTWIGMLVVSVIATGILSVSARAQAMADAEDVFALGSDGLPVAVAASDLADTSGLLAVVEPTPPTMRPAPAPEPALFSAGRPGTAVFLGLACTAAPLAIGAALASASGGANGGDGGLALVAGTLGVVIGPAVGLNYGGRPDLAQRGLLVRTVGVGAMALGIYGVAMGMEGYGDPGAAIGLFSVGVAGGVLTSFSWLYDIAVTPSATSEAQRPHASLGLRSDGRLAATVTF